MSRKIILLSALLGVLLPVACRPPSSDEVLADTEENFRQGQFRTALKELMLYMRRNPGDFHLRTKRLDYVARAQGLGGLLNDAEDIGVSDSIKPSGDGYRGALVRWLEAGLADERPEVRRAAAEALGDLGVGAGVEALKKMLAGQPQERSAAISTLVAMKKPTSWELLATELGKADVPPELFAESDRRTSPQSVLLEAVKSPVARVRAGALLALGAIGANEQALPAVRKALADTSAEVRGAACRSLGALRSADDRPTIEKVLRTDTASLARSGAAAALGQLFDKASVPALWAAYANKKEAVVVRGEAAYALSGFSSSEDGESAPPVSPARAQAIKRSRGDAAMAEAKDLFALAAGELQDRRAIPGLKEAMVSADARIRKAAAALLWQFEDKTVDAFLEQRLRNAQGEADAEQVLRGIVSWQSNELAAVLGEFVRTTGVPKPLRLLAVRTLAGLGGELGPKVAMSLIAENKLPAWLRGAAIDACRVKAVEAVLPMLTNLVQGGPKELRPAAARALRALGGKGQLKLFKRLILDGEGKVRELKNDAKGEVEKQHSPLLIHLTAGVATWL